MKERKGWVCPGGHFNRRDFLRVGSLSFVGVHLTQYLTLKEALAVTGDLNKRAKAQGCILVWLGGGPSQMDTWDPKPNSSFKPISTKVAGIQISELFPRLAKRMDKLSIIRSMQTNENRHLLGHHEVATGHRPHPAMRFPSFGAIVSKEAGRRNELPPHVMIPGMPGKKYDEFFKGHFIGAEYDPMLIPDPTQENFDVPDLSLPDSLSKGVLEDRRTFLKIVDHFYRQAEKAAVFSHTDTFMEQASRMILSPEVREAFDLSQESEKTKEAYGQDLVGQSLLLARRLVEKGSRFVTTSGYKGAWDTHQNNDQRHRDQLGPSLDRSLSALLDDLEQRGLLESTVVLVMGEFGRTDDINPRGGRDHWPHCWSTLLGGGGIRGGQVIGASNETGAYPAERKTSMGDLFATVYKTFGIDWRKEYMHPIGRPLKIANSFDDTTGIPIPELI